MKTAISSAVCTSAPAIVILPPPSSITVAKKIGAKMAPRLSTLRHEGGWTVALAARCRRSTTFWLLRVELVALPTAARRLPRAVRPARRVARPRPRRRRRGRSRAASPWRAGGAASASPSRGLCRAPERRPRRASITVCTMSPAEVVGDVAPVGGVEEHDVGGEARVAGGRSGRRGRARARRSPSPRRAPPRARASSACRRARGRAGGCRRTRCPG